MWKTVTFHTNSIVYWQQILHSIEQLSMWYSCVTLTSASDHSYFTNNKDFGRGSPIICAAKVLLLFFIIPCVFMGRISCRRSYWYVQNCSTGWDWNKPQVYCGRCEFSSANHSVSKWTDSVFAVSVCKAGFLLRPACESWAVTKLTSGNPKLCYKN